MKAVVDLSSEDIVLEQSLFSLFISFREKPTV